MEKGQNLALNRPAKQSSTSRWSTNSDPNIDARIGNNGDIESNLYFHTGWESKPWWQVELDGIFVVESIYIYNRVDLPERLKRFTLLRSEDCRYWYPIYSKSDSSVFNELSVKIKKPGLAKFIKLVLDDSNFLHFREIQVFGYRPEAEDEKFLRSEDLRFLREVYMIPEGRTGHISKIEEFNVFVDELNYSSNICMALDDGGYEFKERELVSKFLSSSDRVLEVGTALGLVTMTAAKVVGPANVITFDANPQIVADARSNFERNGLPDIRSELAILVNRRRYLPGSQVEFYIAKEFWASRLFIGDNSEDIISEVRIMTKCLEDELIRHKANVIICDIEGGEVDLFYEADLSAVRLIIMETHYSVVGEIKTDNMIKYLIMQGFHLHLVASVSGVVVLRRL